MLGWIKCLYGEIVSKVQVNGWLTNEIEIKSGVRQGCPMSPVLFVYVIEPWIRMLKKDKVVSGVEIPGSGGRSVDVIAYMDDVTILCKSEAGLRRVKLLIDIFSLVSDFRVNMKKSVCKRFGEWKEKDLSQWEVCKGAIEVLGIKFSENINGRESWMVVLEKVNKKIGFWSLRVLSLEGKILIIKAVLIPILLYVNNVFPAPDRILRKIIRNIKLEKLKRQKIVKKKNKGGKNMVDIEKFLAVKYVSSCVVLSTKETLDIEKFLAVKYVSSCVVLSTKETLAGCMLKYLAGNSLRKFGLYETNLRKPVCFEGPWFYVRIERYIRRNELQGISKAEWMEKKKVIGIMEGRQELEVIGGLNEVESVNVWKNVSNKELTPRQKDIAWLAVHKCLPTREFQRRRRLVDSETCPREECRGVENVNHLMWECDFAKQVWRGLGKLIKGLTGVEWLTFNMMLYDLTNIEKGKARILWFIMCCVK
ncbi:uncharacterized protein LOC121396900 [Xenopus laevis]|uniref:Uncharacterized protein LOC121396900 n=1 Tax=Xenopus laevis TaxID=8355 RepID=A0A8J1LFX0_XENLA|nr:uncharacterized protein LOC121396900 [Xenopus laevis]